MKLVGRSFVSAITHTPASGPLSLLTTPEMYPSGARRWADTTNPTLTAMASDATAATAIFIGSPSDVHDGKHTLEILDHIAAGRRPPLVRDVASEPQIRDRLRHEPVIELLRIVQLVPARHAGRMEMRDPLKVIADVRADIAVHDLHVVDVEQ